MSLTKLQIPPIDRKEWELIVTRKSSFKFKIFVLQIMNDELHRKIKTGELKKEPAIEMLYILCLKYAISAQNDLEVVFKKW